MVHRSDGSGTTFVWADYLSKASTEWKARVGAHTSLAWPAGVGGKGNGGVAEKVTRVRGALGYIDYTYAVRANLAYAVVQNPAGAFVTPGRPSFEAATIGVDWKPEQDFDVLLTDAPAANAYPIMATSFALVRRYPKDQGRARAMVDFLRFVLEKGQDLAIAQQYVPLPASLVEQIEGYWEVARR